jgi:A/G-specific adenine glycosylase
MPLTGLARKILQRLDVMAVRPVRLPETEEPPAKSSASSRKRS